jgi:sugar O-acyltransferase (sialic acid O-acetyltransferase NeuD family)
LFKKRVIIFGAGGHAKVIADIVEKQGAYSLDGFVSDATTDQGKTLIGYPVLGRSDFLDSKKDECHLLIGIGNNHVRDTLYKKYKNLGYHFATAIHPSAQLGKGCVIEEGCVVMAGVCINSDAHIYPNAIINTGATIDHDVVIHQSAQICPGCHLCGAVSVGESAFVGSGAIVIQQINIGANAVVGAGSTVIRNVAEGLRVVGSPAVRVLS